MRNMEGWYKIRLQDIMENGGISILHYYNGSIPKAIQVSYPTHKFLPWKFDTLSKGYWDKLDNQRALFSWLYNELGFQSFQDYYKLKRDVVKKFGVQTLLKRHDGSSFNAMGAIFPQHQWDKSKFFW